MVLKPAFATLKFDNLTGINLYMRADLTKGP